MGIKQLTDDEALALNGTTDSDTGLVYPALLEARWGEAVLRAFDTLLSIAVPDLQIVEIEGNADAVGVLPGKAMIAGTVYEHAGDTDSGGVIDGLTDNDTTFVWAEPPGSGTSPAINSAVDATGWPSGDHIKLAKVTMSGGAIDSIEDMRTAAMLTDAADALAAHEAATSVHGVSGDVVGTSDTQTVSGKTVGLSREASASGFTSSGKSIAAITDTTSARTVTLATADAKAGRVVVVKDESGGAGSQNAITIDTEGGETIDGAGSTSISTDHGSVRLYSDGTNWFTF